MRFLFNRLITLSRCLPAWLRMPVIGGGILVIVLSVRFVVQIAAGRADDEPWGAAVAFIGMGFAAGFLGGLVAYGTWRLTHKTGRFGYCATGACSLLAYLFAIAALIGHTKGESGMPDSTGDWLLFTLYPAGLGILGGWFAYPGPSPNAESEPGGPA